MQQIVSITSQGQITIPAVFRKLLKLDKFKKALVRAEKNKIIVEAIPDIMELDGSLANIAMKKKNIKEIMNIEKKAIAKAVGKRYLLKNK